MNATKIRDASPSSPVVMGKAVNWRPGPVAVAPDDAAFEKSALWQLRFPDKVSDGLSEIFVEIRYVGDVGRLYDHETLLDDNFYNGSPWEVGLKRFSQTALSGGLELKILPLRKDAPIFLPQNAWPKFGDRQELAELQSIVAHPEYVVTLTASKTSLPSRGNR